MALSRNVKHTLTNPVLADLRRLVALTEHWAADTRVSIRITPRDRPMDSEQHIITVEREEE